MSHSQHSSVQSRWSLITAYQGAYLAPLKPHGFINLDQVDIQLRLQKEALEQVNEAGICAPQICVQWNASNSSSLSYGFALTVSHLSNEQETSQASDMVMQSKGRRTHLQHWDVGTGSWLPWTLGETLWVNGKFYLGSWDAVELWIQNAIFSRLKAILKFAMNPIIICNKYSSVFYWSFSALHTVWEFIKYMILWDSKWSKEASICK